MTWKLTSWGRTRTPLVGVPWRDLDDAEFAAAEGRYPELRERGYFEETPVEPGERPAARRSRATAAAEPAATEEATAVTDSEEAGND